MNARQGEVVYSSFLVRDREGVEIATFPVGPHIATHKASERASDFVTRCGRLGWTKCGVRADGTEAVLLRRVSRLKRRSEESAEVQSAEVSQ